MKHVRGYVKNEKDHNSHWKLFYLKNINLIKQKIVNFQ
jgi:hypothetical protein